MAEKFYWEGGINKKCENLCAVYNVKCIPFEISKKKSDESTKFTKINK